MQRLKAEMNKNKDHHKRLAKTSSVQYCKKKADYMKILEVLKTGLDRL